MDQKDHLLGYDDKQESNSSDWHNLTLLNDIWLFLSSSTLPHKLAVSIFEWFQCNIYGSFLSLGLFIFMGLHVYVDFHMDQQKYSMKMFNITYPPFFTLCKQLWCDKWLRTYCLDLISYRFKTTRLHTIAISQCRNISAPLKSMKFIIDWHKWTRDWFHYRLTVYGDLDYYLRKKSRI